MVGTLSGLVSFLQTLVQHGPSFGLYPNLSKCEVFWPSGNQCSSIMLAQEKGASN